MTLTTLRNFALTILAGLAISSAPALADGTTEHFFTVEIAEGRLGAMTPPVPQQPKQTVVATVWNRGDDVAPVKIATVDAMTGKTLGVAEADAAPGTVSVMVVPARQSSTGYVMFQADGTPLRAKVHISMRVFEGSLSAASLTQEWGRTFEPGPVSRPTSFMTEPLILTDAHQLELQLYNRGGRAAVTVRAWDAFSKKEIIGKAEIVEGSAGARIEIPSEIASQLAPLVPGGEANGMIQLELMVEPLDGPADITATAVASTKIPGPVKYGNITLKRGYVD